MATQSNVLVWRIPNYNPWGYKESDMTEQLSMPAWERKNCWQGAGKIWTHSFTHHTQIPRPMWRSWQRKSLLWKEDFSQVNNWGFYLCIIKSDPYMGCSANSWKEHYPLLSLKIYVFSAFKPKILDSQLSFSYFRFPSSQQWMFTRLIAFPSLQPLAEGN